jgi:baseplate J-like protein
MNPETVFVIERPFQDIVDDLLTAVVGGVTNEPVIYDVKADLYTLARPALDVRGITGRVDGNRHTFQKSVDFLFSEGDNAVVWQPGGKQPDDDTTFYVDYFVPGSTSPITDINVGSVTRTISEAIGREIAVVYEQINQAYRGGFVDSAGGRSLDFVVSILGVSRKTKELAVGLATFFREPAVEGSITIPAGTAVTTAKAEVRFETSEARTLQRGQARIDAPIRAGEDFKGDKGKVPAGAISEMFAPVAGISRVTNFEPTFLGAEDETDDQLRARAKAVLRSLGKATLAALERVILEGRGRPVEVWDPDSPGAHEALPGTVTILVEVEPERMASIAADVHDTRAAGVLSTLVARYVFMKPRLAVAVRPGLTAQGKEKVAASVIEAMQAYVDTLTSGQPAEGSKLLDAAKQDDVAQARLADVVTWRSDLTHSGEGRLADEILAALAAVPPGDDAARRAALEAVLSPEVAVLAPAGRRIADRGLVLGPAGARATDAEIEAGTFSVTATIDGQPWWVVLDMAPDDVVIREQ